MEMGVEDAVVAEAGTDWHAPCVGAAGTDSAGRPRRGAARKRARTAAATPARARRARASSPATRPPSPRAAGRAGPCRPRRGRLRVRGTMGLGVGVRARRSRNRRQRLRSPIAPCSIACAAASGCNSWSTDLGLAAARAASCVAFRSARRLSWRTAKPGRCLRASRRAVLAMQKTWSERSTESKEHPVRS